MRKFVKVCLVLGLLIAIAGGAFVGIGFANKSFTVSSEPKTFEIKDNFENITISAETADIEIKPSEDGKSKVDYVDYEKIKYNVGISNNELSIKSNRDELKWYEYVYNFGVYKNNKVVITLTANTLKKLNIKTTTSDIKIQKGFTLEEVTIENSTGDIEVLSNVTKSLSILTTTGDIKLSNIDLQDDVKLTASTGEIHASNLKANNIEIKTSTGDVEFDNVIAKGKMTINSTTGDIHLNDCDGDTLYLKSTTGDIKGRLLSAKSFQAQTRTGDINVPSTSGNECKIETSTGDITITIK